MNWFHPTRPYCLMLIASMTATPTVSCVFALFGHHYGATVSTWVCIGVSVGLLLPYIGYTINLMTCSQHTSPASES